MVKLALGIARNTKANISAFGDFVSDGNNTEISLEKVKDIDKITIPAMPYYISISHKKQEIHVSEIRVGKQDRQREPFLKYTNIKREPKFFRFEHNSQIYAHYRCCKSDCKRQTFSRISGVLINSDYRQLFLIYFLHI